MKKSQNSKNQDFSYYFCLMIEGSEAGFGSVPHTNRSETGRPKNMRILRIWIRNTACAPPRKYNIDSHFRLSQKCVT
jgi:hypothetical protein